MGVGSKLLKGSWLGAWAVFMSTAVMAAPAPVQPTAAWVPEPPAVARNAVAYLVLTGGDQDDVLQGVTTPAAEVVELHETSLADGVLRMKPVTSLPVAARQQIEFVPGGLHLMLIGLRQPLRYGGKVLLEMRFAKAGLLKIEAEVHSLPPTPAASRTEDHDQHHHHH
jgi:copper(I)-binding protein